MKKYLKFFEKAGKLKETERKGWKRIGIDEPESVADHSYRAALMALILGDVLEVDSFKLVKLLLVHDIAESEIGDITPEDPISNGEKFEKEEKAIQELSPSFEEKLNLTELWKEFERGGSREAIIARDIDRLEMVLQALEYKEENPELDISGFISSSEENIESEEMERLLHLLLEN